MSKRKKDKSGEKGAEVKIPAEEYQKLCAAAGKNQEYQDRLLRSQAEFENLQKRTFREKQQFLKLANEGLISELINILDNFELAFASANKMTDYKSLHQGVEMILTQIHKLLENNGVKVIDCLGKTFNPAQEEAIAHIETDDYPENTVIEQVRKGYTIAERLIRPAIVKVATKKVHSS